jgi:hypothetical protein
MKPNAPKPQRCAIYTRKSAYVIDGLMRNDVVKSDIHYGYAWLFRS